jgi:hypothetical protein
MEGCDEMEGRWRHVAGGGTRGGEGTPTSPGGRLMGVVMKLVTDIRV